VVVVRGRIADLARTPLLAPDEARRADAMRPAAAAEFVAGRSLLRRVLARFAGRDPQSALVEVPDEKPQLADRDGLDFNVAHGGDVVLVAVAKQRQVGVDVEPIDPRRRIDDITAAALGDDAAFELAHLPPYRRAARFTCWWVRVEALCKATGAGLMFPVDTAAPGFSIRDIAMPRGYRAAVAFSGSPAPTIGVFDDP
jgi:4'-phosphopantetheinyl transferase